jgi:predicted RNase H-like nuclease (RuvC/YqgF family)
MSLADLINLSIAVFTAAAAIAAWVSTTASLKATEQANKAAEDSRKAAEESRKIALQQTEALMLAARANALASRISFYTEQIRPYEKQFEDLHNRGSSVETNAKQKMDELRLEQDHLVRWLDQQTNALGVGLGFKISDSKYNDRVKDQA